MAIQKYIRTVYPDGKIIYSNLRNNIGVPIVGENKNFEAEVVTKWYDGSTMDASKADGKIYLRSINNGEFLRVVLPNFGESFLEKDTVQQMRDINSTEILLLKMGYYKGVKLNGYYIKNDTPAPIEYYLSQTTSLDDGGSVIVIGDIKLEHIFIGEVDVRYFGAKGDFIQDDTTYIQKTLSYANNPNVSSIYIPTGHYLITDTLIPPTDCLVYGDGNGSHLEFEHERYSISQTVKWMFKLTNQKNSKFEYLKLDGGATTFDVVPYDVDGAEFIFYFKPDGNREIDNISISNCTLTRSWSSAIQSYGRQAEPYPHPVTSNIRISDNFFTRTGFHGIGLNEFVDTVITNNTFYDIGLVAQSGSSGSGLACDISAGCEDVIVSNNIVNLSGGGFKCQTHPIPSEYGGGYQYSKRVQFKGNSITNLRTGTFFEIFYGVKLDGIGCSAVDNTIVGGSGHGVMTSGQAIDCTIRNNKIFNVGRSGIELVGNYHSVENNTVIGSTTQGLTVNGSYNKIVGNVIKEGSSQGLRLLNGSYNNISENIVVDNTGEGIDLKPYGTNVVEQVTLINNTCFDTRTGSSRTQTRGIDAVSSNLNNVNSIGNRCFNNTQFDLNMPATARRNQELGSNAYEAKSFNGIVGVAGQWKIGDVIRNMNAQPANVNADQRYIFGYYNIQNNGSAFIPYGFIGEHVGSVHPEGNVSARVGARYTKIDETGFNLIWIKHYGHNTNTGWRLLTLQSYGSTANRPTFLTTVDIGFKYYDQTLLREFIWNGSIWVGAYPAQLSPDTANPVGATYSESEVQAILTELRDLKTKLRTAGILLP